MKNNSTYDDILARGFADDWAALDSGLLRLNHSLRTSL